jgi:tRNA(fMet)-specific endonuclease VapC
MRYLLDANHLSPLVTLIHPLRQRVLDRIIANDQFFVSVPVITETLFGFHGTARAAANFQEWSSLRNRMGFMHVNEQDAVNAARLRSELRQRGRQLTVLDALIAAIALRAKLILLTTDRDFDAVPGLQIQNWIEQLRAQ